MSDEIPPLLTYGRARTVLLAWAREHGLRYFDLPRRKNSDQYLYFAESPSGRVKVGWSRNPSHRVAEYRESGERFRLVVVVAGFCFGDEGMFHQSAKALRGGRRAEVYPPGPVSELARRLIAA